MSTDSTAPADSAKDLGELEHELHHHTTLPRTAFSDVIESALDKLGMFSSWLWIATVVAILWSVIGRYVFSSGSVMLEEVQWHLAGAAWLIGLSFTLVHDDHVRVDILHERFSNHTRAWIEFLGILLLLLPFVVIACMELAPYAMAAFEQGERSQAPDGLPARWILKGVLTISVGLLGVAALARLTRTTSRLFGWPAGQGESK